MKLLFTLLILSLNLVAMDAFVSPNQLKLSLNDKNSIIIDVADLGIYKKSHIKGAIHSNIFDFVDKNSTYYLMKSPEDIQDEIQDLGINTDSHVTIYAHNTKQGTLNSSYLAFILIAHGFENISILDGGYMSWIFQNEFFTSAEISKPENNGNFVVSLRDDFFIDAKALNDNYASYAIIDARSPESYYGISHSDKIDIKGHIPKAKSSYYLYNFLADSSLRVQKELDEIYIDGFGLTQNDNIIVYGENVFSASLEFYILYNHMGFKNTKLYHAGLLEWSRDLKLPMTRFKWE